MEIIDLKNCKDIESEKLKRLYTQFELLLIELRKQKLSEATVNDINDLVNKMNDSPLKDDELLKLIRSSQSKILKQVEKDANIVPKHYYRNLWMLLGMSGIGLPLGVVFGLSIGNMGMLGLGLPVGMGAGIMIGSGLDKKALKEGRQLNLEVK